MAIYSRSSVQNLDNWRFWIRKYKHIVSFNKTTRQHWQNLFVCKRFNLIQVWIFDQKAWKYENKAFKWFKCIYWVFKYDGRHLWEYWWLQPKQKKKNLIVFDDMIADIMSNKKFQAIIEELFIRCRKLNIVFITKSYFSVPKNVRLNLTNYLIMKINNKRELQNTALNHSADIDYKDFVNTYRECTRKPYTFLTI